MSHQNAAVPGPGDQGTGGSNTQQADEAITSLRRGSRNRRFLNSFVSTYRDGKKILVVSPGIAWRGAENAPSAELARGIEARRRANIGGQCPECGARYALPNRATRRAADDAGCVLRVELRHDDGCAASSPVLLPRMAAWIDGGAE